MKDRLSTLAILAMLISTTALVMTIPVEGGHPLFVTNVKAVSNTTYDDRDQIVTDIARAPDGRIYMAYHSTWTGYYTDVYLIHSDDDGETWSEQVRVDDTLRDGNESNDKTNQGNPSVAVAPNGTVYVAWNDKRDTKQSTQIRLAWSEDGTNFTRSLRVDPQRLEKTWDTAEPRLRFNGDGRMICVWRDRLDDGARFHIWGSYSTDGGVTWAYPVRINTDDLYLRDHRNHRIAVHENMVYVTWEDNRDNNSFHPYLSVSTDGGITYSAERMITDDLEFENTRETAWPAVDSDGNLYIVWMDKRSGRAEIWLTKSTDQGATLSPNKKISRVPEYTFADSNPCIIAGGSGRLHVAFQRSGPQGKSTDEGDIFFTGSIDGGATWTDIIHVDDTDRYAPDASPQTNPIVGLDRYGNAIIGWRDSRTLAATQIDLYCSKHSGLEGSTPIPPQIRNMESFSPFKYPDRTSNTANTTFRFQYVDFNNDRPADGYPQVTAYTDAAATQTLVGPVTMTMDDGGDFDFMDGSSFSAGLVLNTSGHVYWKVVVRDESLGPIVSSPITKGPLVDAETPTVEMISPSPGEWITSDTVEVRARVHDTGGAGIDPNSIVVRKALNGLDTMEIGVKMRGMDRIDDDTYEAWHTIYLEGGSDNYVMVEVKDHTANGPGASEPVNVWIDFTPPYFTAVRPESRKVHLYEEVNCSVAIMDHPPGSQNVISAGVDVDSIEYCFRTTSGPLSEWMRPDGIIDLGKGEYRAYVHLEFFDEGFYNFIKWRASDVLGQAAETGEIRVNVQVPDNYPPRFLEGARMYPTAVVSETPHLFWDDAFDEEGDHLEYRIMIMNYARLYMFTRPQNIGARTFFDVPDSTRLDPGLYFLQVNVTDNIGGWEIKEWYFRVLDSGTPPPADIPRIDIFYLPDSNGTITWGRSPSDGSMNVTYMARLGTGPWKGDVLEWTDIGAEPTLELRSLDLPIGAYTLQIMAQSNGNFSRVTDTTVKINDYNVLNVIPAKYTAHRGKAALKRAPYYINLTNLATYGDNVTLTVRGDIIDKGWGYFSKSSSEDLTVLLESKKDLTIKTPDRIAIIFYPPSGAEPGTYSITVTVASEDGSIQGVQEVAITVTDPESESIIQEVTNSIYDFIIFLFPFLEPIPKAALLPLFFIVVALFVLAIVSAATALYRREVRRRKHSDPYAEHKRVYKEMYGVEPSQDALDRMMAGQEPSILSPGGTADIVSKDFDESFLESESPASNKAGQNIPEE